MDWASFLPIFSKWTGLKFVEIWKKKLKKLEKKNIDKMLKNLQKFHKFKPSPFTEQRAQSIYFLFFSLQISILNQNFEDFEEK